MQGVELSFDPIMKLTKDLRKASETMTSDEARFLVDYYYMLQKSRVGTGNQILALAEEPHEVIAWINDNLAVLERNIKSALDVYGSTHAVGAWAKSIYGIGPIIAAGLLAHIDITKTPSISALWSFAGLNPTAVWAKGKKRPWNARLKVLCWHAGECFKRTSGSPKSFYGKFYRERKELEVQRNEDGMFKELAAATLEKKNIGKSTEAYKHYAAEKLPPGRLDLRATRYATKLFLSHFWQVLYEIHYESKPPAPWIIQHGGHIDLVPIPNWPMKP